MFNSNNAGIITQIPINLTNLMSIMISPYNLTKITLIPIIPFKNITMIPVSPYLHPLD
jgi:hypothetical protein